MPQLCKYLFHNRISYFNFSMNGIFSRICRKSRRLCREFNPNSQPVRNKKIEKTHAKEKQSHAQDSIYVVQQFAYIHGVVRISLLSGKKIQSTAVQFFFFSLSQRLHQETLITKTTVSISYIQDSQLAMKWAYRPKPPLHGLNLRKSPIKKPRNIISGRVVIRIKHN